MTSLRQQPNDTTISSLDLAKTIPELTKAQSLKIWCDLKNIKEKKNLDKYNDEIKKRIQHWNEMSLKKAKELYLTIEEKLLEGTKNKRNQIKLASHIGFYKGMKEEEWNDAVLWSGKYKDNFITFDFHPYTAYLKTLISKSQAYRDCKITTSKNSRKDSEGNRNGVIFMTFLVWGDKN